MGDIMLTTEVARFLGKSAETVRLYERRGKLPAMRTAGGVRLFKRADVLQLAELLVQEAEAAGMSHDADA
jgi:excisionase family DNA binding protein